MAKPSVSIYFYGCDKPEKCKGCHNYELQKTPEREISFEMYYKELQIIVSQYLSFHPKLRVSLLGGEPLAQYNVDILKKTLERLYQDYADVEITLYSWRSVDTIEKNFKEIVEFLDYGVLGEFKEEFYQEGYYPITSNQTIYDFQNKRIMPHIKLK